MSIDTATTATEHLLERETELAVIETLIDQALTGQGVARLAQNMLGEYQKIGTETSADVNRELKRSSLLS